MEGIRLYGAGKWRKISQQLFGQGSTRTSDQIGQRWRKVLRPEIQNQHKGKWTEEESNKLAALVREHGEDWERVAQLMGTRSRKQCKYRWENGIDPALNRSDWSPDEDAAVLRVRFLNALPRRCSPRTTFHSGFSSYTSTFMRVFDLLLSWCASLALTGPKLQSPSPEELMTKFAGVTSSCKIGRTGIDRHFRFGYIAAQDRLW